MSTYDDASWHYEGDYPKELPEVNGATHIGMLLTWIIENNLCSLEVEEDFADELAEVKNKTLTGAAFLMQCFDGKLSDYDLNNSGNDFVRAYYDEDAAFSKMFASYLEDYTTVLNADAKHESLYYIEDSWENYAILKSTITQRFKEWQQFDKEV